jgi:hypothetical protein
LLLNNKKTNYKFIYSSKHNFFKLKSSDVKQKKNILNKFGILEKKILIPEKTDDTKINLNDFVETVLDHCTYSDLRNIRNKTGKKRLHFKKFKECKISFINDENFDGLTLKKFEKEYINTKKNIVLKNYPKIKKEKKIKKKFEKKEKNKKNFNLSFFWEGMNFPIIANLNLNTKNSGIINLNLTRYNDDCVGTLVFKKYQFGTWSIICPNNSNREKKYKKNLSLSGKVELLDDNHLKGYGLDLNQKKVNFVSSEPIFYE